MTINNADTGEIRRIVQQQYGQRALRVIELTDVTPQFECGSENCGNGNCGNADCAAEAHAHTEAAACCGPADTEHAMALYNEAQLQGLPVEAMAASAGCGNPTALADLRPGETVLDLGSGGGIDCFIAAEQVGESGRVFGLDMTPEMLALANTNRNRMGLSNVEFIEGHLEDIPLPDSTVDVVISNCVICLSPDKDAVFREAYRVLTPGGRLHVSDMLALTAEGPTLVDADSWASCIGGAEYRETYLARMVAAGFTDISTTEDDLKCDENQVSLNVASVKVSAHKPR
ncbi:Arsenite methyltransferase [Geodia barretti]|uniref:Arsenite methyltransferase n=1 Tax=Geodia barretti TaxID=519541 RepID=A0AA35XD66_GEOBA|nr:Arsenite methyltransferase [Geodia barretti]